MTALEQEIITQISKLDASRQRQVLEYARKLENVAEQTPMMRNISPLRSVSAAIFGQ